MNIYMLTLEIVTAFDVELAGAVVIAETPAEATRMIVAHLDEDWEEASVETIGTAKPGSEPVIVAVDTT